MKRITTNNIRHPHLEILRRRRQLLAVIIGTVILVLISTTALGDLFYNDDDDGPVGSRRSFITKPLRPLSSSSSWSNPVGRRGLSKNLGGGKCKWEPPNYDVPDDIDFYKSLVVGYPSGGKRLIFSQMEAMTGWPARDEWEFEFVGMTNHPFIKSNYPHHDGIWGWQQAANQTVLMIMNIRRSMVEFHDIMWDLGYATNWQDAHVHEEDLYVKTASKSGFLEWRDRRLVDEIHWYSWFVDFWMEGGVLRDILTHKLTTKDHWDKLVDPNERRPEELEYYYFHGADYYQEEPVYNPHCLTDVSGGCEPVSIISSDKLIDYISGPGEATKIGEALMNNPAISQHVIEKETWDCIWNELIVQRKGMKTVLDRPGNAETDYNFSAEMLEEMISQLDRLISKYSSNEWNTQETANRLVSIFTEHRDSIQRELEEVNSGVRTLKENDFLGPKERKKRRFHARKSGIMGDHKSEDDVEKEFHFFRSLERVFEKQRREKKRIDAVTKHAKLQKGI